MIDAFFKLDGLTVEMKPTITKWGYEDLEDDPEQHRWRAQWNSNFDSTVYGISLTAHRVLKLTARGAWIEVYGYRQATRQPWEEGAPALEWVEHADPTKRFVLNGSGQSWAKLTQEEALESLFIRLSRWSMMIMRERDRALSATYAMEKIRPEMVGQAKQIREVLLYNPQSKGAPQ